jgi:hypothetical protein
VRELGSTVGQQVVKLGVNTIENASHCYKNLESSGNVSTRKMTISFGSRML